MSYCDICGKPELSADLSPSIELWRTCNCTPAPPEPREPAAREASTWLKSRQIDNPLVAQWEGDKLNPSVADLLEAYSAELRAERDAAVDMLRVLMEETIFAGYPGGDRNQTLANVRTMKASLLQAREALKLAIVCQTCEGTGEVTIECQSCQMDGMGTCTCAPEPCMECDGRKWSAPEKAIEAVTAALASTSAPEGE